MSFVRYKILCLLLSTTASLAANGSLTGLSRGDSGASFTNVSDRAGITFVHSGPAVPDPDWQFGTGAAWLDYDRDGDLDVYVTTRNGGNALYENRGDGSFVDQAQVLGVVDALHDGAGVAAADFNNDGWIDLYLANADADVLLKNMGGHSFRDVTVEAGLVVETTPRGTSASWGDFDNDGYVDLYVSNHIHLAGRSYDRQDRLFHNNGDETFTDVSQLLDARNLGGFGFIGAWTDMDDDGDVDIFLVNDCLLWTTPVRAFRNDGGTNPFDWHFEEISADLGLARCENGMGIAIADFDRDGSLDYFYTNRGTPALIRNGYGLFEDVTIASGIAERAERLVTPDYRWTWGANFLDFDLDGWMDLFIASGAYHAYDPPAENLLYRNSGHGITFADVTDGSGVADTGRSRTSVVGDYDDDGDADLFVVDYEGRAALYRNENANGYHYLTVELEGVASNRCGIGAKVEVETPDGLRQLAEIHSGTSLGGGDALAASFGLAGHDHVSEVRVRWPSGIQQVVRDVPTNRRISIRESELPLYLALSVGQEDAATEFLNVSVAVSEPVGDKGIDLRAGAAHVTASLVDPSNNLWLGRVELHDEGRLAITACATGETGRFGCAITEAVVVQALAGREVVLRSSDGVFNARIPGGVSAGPTYLTLVSIAGQTTGLPGGADESGEEDLPAFRIGPAAAAGKNQVTVEFDYERLNLPGTLDRSRLYIELVGHDRLDSYIDRGAGVIRAVARGLGDFRLRVGEPGAAQDARYEAVRLLSAYPNPFNHQLTVTFELETSQRVRLAVYDVVGRLVNVLRDGVAPAGVSSASWNGASTNGAAASGVYFLRVETTHRTRTKKVLLIH